MTGRWKPEAETDRSRVNRMITAPQVRVIDHDGSQAGVMSIRQALSFAEERGLDLVEVASNAHPPVCKVVDYGKFRYERTRRARTARKKQHTIDVKEVRLRPKIDDHDYDFKCKNARKFLEGRDKVKVTVLFRGRERTHAERGRALLDKFSADLADVGIVEQQAQLDGRSAMMVMVLAPKPIS
ncbi:translation initiation factor IF-3 [Candidatus Fermentibacteria bacterium]|nr:translation initiation factor IF-3 [Candidatus Fermentibacteria bacterium]